MHARRSLVAPAGHAISFSNQAGNSPHGRSINRGTVRSAGKLSSALKEKTRRTSLTMASLRGVNGVIVLPERSNHLPTDWRPGRSTAAISRVACAARVDAMIYVKTIARRPELDDARVKGINLSYTPSPDPASPDNRLASARPQSRRATAQFRLRPSLRTPCCTSLLAGKAHLQKVPSRIRRVRSSRSRGRRVAASS